MTDMRATERLLEVIGEIADYAIEMYDTGYAGDNVYTKFYDVQKIITELRRRGDTLVRAADLRIVLEYCDIEPSAWSSEYDRVVEVTERFENALGGKPL